MRMYGTAYNAKSKLDLEGERHIATLTQPRRRRWGRWYLDTRQPVSLNIMLAPWYEYWIDLNRCQTASQRERWLEHMAEKTTVISSHDIDDLAIAFRDLKLQGKLLTPAGTVDNVTLRKITRL